MHKVILYITIILVAAFVIISPTFSPIWLLLLVIAILYPMRRDKDARPVFVLSLTLLFLYFLLHYASILVPFIIGLGIAYILAPLVDLLERRKVPRVLAILAFLIPIIAFFPLVVFLILAGLVNELQGLIEKIPEVIEQIQVFSGAVITKLSERGIEIEPNIIANTITSHLTNITSGLFSTIEQIGKGITGIIMLVYNLVFIPLSAYLFLADRERIGVWFTNLFPPGERKRMNKFLQRLNFSLARFFRGTLLLMLIVGCIVGFSLWVLGIRYYLLLGIIAALCNLIPNIGYVLSFVPALLIGVLSPSPLVNSIKIVGVYVGEQLLENFLLGPVIIGKSAKLHPVVVMIVLIMGGAIFGFWGVVLAVPLTICVRELLNFYLDLQL
jgi:predicted PurR-regulated permease PerM